MKWQWETGIVIIVSSAVTLTVDDMSALPGVIL